MKIEDQVLSVKQVRELQELGFDVRKHASLYFVEEKYFVKENFIVLPEQIDITRVPEDVKITPTMTIGDIISVLPVKIEEDYFLSVNSEYCAYSMVGGIDTIFFTIEKEIINNLFKTLVWCIKQKHI
jgi:hypothetical protein